jgi:hypothetical protein
MRLVARRQQKKAARTVFCPCREASDATYKPVSNKPGALLNSACFPFTFHEMHQSTLKKHYYCTFSLCNQSFV